MAKYSLKRFNDITNESYGQSSEIVIYVKEKMTEKPLKCTVSDPRMTVDAAIDFFGCKEPDIEWYKVGEDGDVIYNDVNEGFVAAAVTSVITGVTLTALIVILQCWINRKLIDKTEEDEMTRAVKNWIAKYFLDERMYPIIQKLRADERIEKTFAKINRDNSVRDLPMLWGDKWLREEMREYIIDDLTKEELEIVGMQERTYKIPAFIKDI